MLKKLKRWFHMTFVSFFYGMKGADEAIVNPSTSESGEITQKQDLKGNVFSEMLQEQQTQQVQETRDAYYRAYREADKYKVQVSGIDSDGEIAGDLSASAVKKSPIEKPRIPLYETKGYKVKIVQGVKDYENDLQTKMEEAQKAEVIDSKDTLIYNIEYTDGVTPHFFVERYITKLVIKENAKGKIKFDLYFSTYARQFYKRDSLFIAEVNRVLKKEIAHSDFDDIKTISFISDKAYGVDSLHKLTLSNIKYKKIDIFDGSFVLEFDAVLDDEDITAKYHMDSLDEKYAKKAPKHETTELSAIMRRVDKEEKENNFETTILKLK